MGNKVENPNQLNRIPSQHHTGLQVIIIPVVGAVWEFPGYPMGTSGKKKATYKLF